MRHISHPLSCRYPSSSTSSGDDRISKFWLSAMSSYAWRFLTTLRAPSATTNFVFLSALLHASAISSIVTEVATKGSPASWYISLFRGDPLWSIRPHGKYPERLVSICFCFEERLIEPSILSNSATEDSKRTWFFMMLKLPVDSVPISSSSKLLLFLFNGEFNCPFGLRPDVGSKRRISGRGKLLASPLPKTRNRNKSGYCFQMPSYV